MTAKLLFLFEFAHAFAATRVRAKGYSRNAAGEPTSLAPAAAKHIPQLRPRLECRWHRDPATGALRAVWQRPRADRGANPSGEDIADGRVRLRPPPAAASGRGALRPAA